MLTIKYQAAFKKDYKRIVKRGYDMRLLEKVIELLANQKPLPEKNRDHQLSGDYAGCRECHITPDWFTQRPFLSPIMQKKRKPSGFRRLTSFSNLLIIVPIRTPPWKPPSKSGNQ